MMAFGVANNRQQTSGGVKEALQYNVPAPKIATTNARVSQFD
jgi:hypothetical protein